MPRRPFRIGRSRTGLGIFATREIRKGAKIAEYKGPLLKTKDAEILEARGSLYLYELNSRWTIDGSPRSNIARYFNHSCNPNAETYDVRHRVFIRTLRRIKPGEEIVYDYGIDYLKYVIGRSNCKCSRCRKRKAKKARLRRAQLKRQAARTRARRRRK
jgi:SET domain-containing protein